MAKTDKQLAVILLNLGTPDAPTAPAIRRYLAEFLSDPNVVNLPRFIWLPILYLFILTFRPRKLVHKYQLVWGTHDGPIRNITRALAKKTQHFLSRHHQDSNITVRSAMTYGEPSVDRVIGEMESDGVSDFLFLPLYPQYATATTAATHSQISLTLSSRTIPNFRFVSNYHQHPAYIHALTKAIERYAQYLANGTRLIFSFHGIPQAQADGGDPYADQCRRTADLVAHNLGLEDGDWTLTFQSRFGPTKWLRPYTSEVLANLPGEGVSEVLMICPGFATDCLETIEEIKLLNRGIFMQAGGTAFRYVKALNATDDHVAMVADIINDHLLMVER
ncbi:MAG: ferrochelatase [Gammaproteobacteria bacterium]|nr:ferrochelatase [Gammaproteobacteria bacterium]